MNSEQLVKTIRERRSFLCVGLDLDLDKMPTHLSDSPEGWFQFNREIIDSTRDLCVSYKPNWAFYEALGLEGLRVLKQTVDYIGDQHLIIADAKRGDIGNTSNKYSTSVFDYFGADAITVAPYMGGDSVTPFRVPGKWLIILALTSNPGSEDFQMREMANGERLFELTLRRFGDAFGPEEAMFVIGATHPEMLKQVRSIVPNHFLLVPGIGAQGGSLEEVCRFGMNDDVGLLVNASRGVIYAGGRDKGYLNGVRESARKIQKAMASFL